MREANAELKFAREQITAIKKHLEETQKLREQAEKSKEEAERAKAEAEQATNEAEQKGYEIGVVETEETLRPRCQWCAASTTPKLGMKPLTELGLKLHLS